MTALVVDASVAAKWGFPEESHEQAAALLDVALAESGVLMAPDLILSELGNLVLTKIRSGEVTREDGEAVFEDFMSAPIELVPSSELAREALALGLTTKCSFYDGLYLALAQAFKVQLVTADRKLLRRLQGTPLAELGILLDDVVL